MTVYLAGTGCALPEPTTLEDAERAGLCTRRMLWRTRAESVCIAEEPGPELAARAAGMLDCGDVDLLLHASVYYQGHDLWSPPSYIQREVLGNNCPAIEVRQQSNGGMAALTLASAYLTGDRKQAMVTTGDRFCLPGFDRFTSDPGTICGDGGTAALLSTQDGFARIRGLVTVSDPGLEKLGRGLDPFADAPLSVRRPISTEAHRSELIAEFGLSPLMERLRSGQQEAYQQALREAGVKAEDVSWFVLPNLGRAKMDAQFFDPLDIDPDRSTWDWGRRVGHLGAGDQIAGLDHLRRTERLEPGQLCVLAGVGIGFTWSVGVLEIVRQ